MNLLRKVDEMRKEIADYKRQLFYSPYDREALDIIMSTICDVEFDDYKKQGGKFNQLPANHNFTEAQYVYDSLGAIGLKSYLERGGKLNPSFVSKDGLNEFITLLTRSSIHDVDLLMDVYIEAGGTFSPKKLSKDGTSEAMLIVICSASKSAHNLDLYLANGGAFNPKARDFRGFNELMCLVDSGGEHALENLQLFIDHDGQFSPDHRDNYGSSEVASISRLGIQGLKAYIDAGGTFSTHFKDGEFTDVMAIAMHAGVEGLKLYIENGGKFSPELKNSKGFTEVDIIRKFCGEEGFFVYFQEISKDPDFTLKSLKRGPKPPRP